MIQKIKVGAVSYLNTKPLVYGFEHGLMKEEVDLSFDYPANVARQLLNDEVDVGLVPVAALPMMENYHIISDYCIGAEGPVASVCLFSDVSLEDISEVLMDYQSRTSVALLKILLAEHWKIKPVLTAAAKGFEEQIKGTTAGLVIGDRAFAQRQRSKYIYDLADAWKQMTGLPFVFAVWASNKKLPVAFTDKFNLVTGEGLQHIDSIVTQQQYTAYDLNMYYTQNISYNLSETKKEALALFQKFLKSAPEKISS